MTTRFALPSFGLSVLLLLGAALLSPASATSTYGLQAQRAWSTMDKCSKAAFEKYPDATAEAVAKRDAFVHQCQRDNRVPMREGLAPNPAPEPKK